jgi:glycosyltransferase involved in cell wall biosynthesis
METTLTSEGKIKAATGKPIKVLYICSQWPTPEKPSIAPFVERDVRAIRHQGVELDPMPYEGGWNIRKYWRAIREMRRRMKENDYDLIHAYFGQCGLVARAQFKLPVIVSYGGSDIEGSPVFQGAQRYKHYVLMTISRILSLIVDQVIVVSENLGRKLPRKDYTVISTALDLDTYQPMDRQEARAKMGLAPDGTYALFAANPENTRKRHGLALEVCKIASKTRPVELVVATKRTPAEVAIFMNACNVLLLTSTNEGSPNIVREALGCNTPVVATDVGDVRERLGHLKECAVSNSDDPQVLADALLRVLETTEGTRPNLRSEVLHIDYHVIGARIVEVYEKALARQRPQSAR